MTNVIQFHGMPDPGYRLSAEEIEAIGKMRDYPEVWALIRYIRLLERELEEKPSA